VALSESAPGRYLSGMHFLRRRRRVDESGDDRPVVDCGWATDTGPRPDNQDRSAVSPGWAVVSDGVGGHAGGALAAQLTVEAVVSVLESAAGDSGAAGGSGDSAEDVLRRAVEAANTAVRDGQRDDPAVADMGATLTVALATSLDPGASGWLVASVGDSPAWLVTAAGAQRVTEDHTLAAELVRAGAISEDEAARHPGRNVIIRSIGGEDTVVPDTTPVTLGHGDALVLTSDGVSDVVGAADVHEITAAAGTATDAARRLVQAALAHGASDNVTAAVVRHVAGSADAAPDDVPAR
jgi:PPM family protein phosphatase